MNEETNEFPLNNESLNPLNSIEDFRLRTIERIHQGDAFVANINGLHPGIVWDFAKLNFKDLQTRDIQEAFLDMASATTELINIPEEQAPEAIQKIRQKLSTSQIDKGFANPDLAQAILNNRANNNMVLNSFIFELKDYVTYGKVFRKPNGQPDEAARQDFEDRILPSLAESITEESINTTNEQ